MSCQRSMLRHLHTQSLLHARVNSPRLGRCDFRVSRLKDQARTRRSSSTVLSSVEKAQHHKAHSFIPYGHISNNPQYELSEAVDFLVEPSIKHADGLRVQMIATSRETQSSSPNTSPQASGTAAAPHRTTFTMSVLIVAHQRRSLTHS